MFRPTTIYVAEFFKNQILTQGQGIRRVRVEHGL